jgi:hypothetical protein
MSLAPPTSGSYPDIATGFAALQAQAKANGFLLEPTTLISILRISAGRSHVMRKIKRM